jgi:hypothetical protein
MSSRASQTLDRLRRIRAVASTCLAVLAGMSSSAIASQPGAGRPDKGVSADAPAVSERIKRVRAALNNQDRAEATQSSRWHLAQWFNFSNFRPPMNPYGSQPNYGAQVPYLPGRPQQQARPPMQMPYPYAGGGIVQPPPRMWRNF